MNFLKDTDKPQPKNIPCFNTSTVARGVFGKYEVEMAAGRLVEYLIHRGQGWKPFTLRGLIQFYDANNWESEDLLYGLLGHWIDDTMGLMNPPCYLINMGKELAFTSLFLERLIK